MPTITISKKELLKTLGKTTKELPDKELKDRISMLGTDLEGIEGDEISVEIFPNRPDLLSLQGFSRALSSFMSIKPGLKNYEVKSSGEKVIIDSSTKDCRPYTACAIIKNLKITEEVLKDIIMIQEKLHITFGRNRKRVAIGIYPMEQIKFPIYFKGLKPEEIRFRPLEARGEMTAKQILEDHPKGKDYAHLMTGLKRYACFIDSNNEIMSMTPIINSDKTGKISEKTTEVFVECSGFDFRIVNETLNMIVTSLADMGGKIYSIELDYKTTNTRETTPNLKPKKMKLDLVYVNKLLGLELKEKESKKLLEKMGYGYDEKTKNALIPSYRTDIMHQVDFAEDIAIAYGYENFEETIPNVATIAEENSLEKFAKKIRNFLVSHNLVETKGFNLISSSNIKKLSIKEKPVVLANSVSDNHDILRPNLLGSLMTNFNKNKQYEYPQRMFEIGRTFKLDNGLETGVRESTSLVIGIIGEEANFTAIRQIADSLFSALGIDAKYESHSHPSFIEGRCATINNKGLFGEISPVVITNYELEYPAAVLEIDLEGLFELVKNK